MNFSILSPLLSIVILLFLLLSLSSTCNFLQAAIDLTPFELSTPTLNEIIDFGRVVYHSPIAILKPKTPQEISLLLKTIYSSSSNNLTVAARGAGHSICGQAQALDGIVIATPSLPTSIKIDKTVKNNSGTDHYFVDVSGGALWVELLEETLKQGLAPRSWTDYLHLSIGGTLSVGGIGGQTFKHGPQISNVLEMDVVTGKGEFVTCSETENSELFNGVLGGLGQFGIITRARIILEIAPQKVKWIRVSYDDFDRFTEDQELLITMGEWVDYVEGFIRLNKNPLNHSSSRVSSHLTLDRETNTERKAVYYTIELAIYYNDSSAIDKTMDLILSRLSFIPSTMYSQDVSYFNFLNRVWLEEQNLRSKGLWEVAHPWLNVFVPRSHIQQFKDLLLQTISETYFDGPILIYPFLRHKWESKISTVLPCDDERDDILYTVSMLRLASPGCVSGSPYLETLLKQNKKLITIATSKPVILLSSSKPDMMMYEPLGNMETMNGMMDVAMMGMNNMYGGDGMGAKQYIPCYTKESEWELHFGEEWERFKALKFKFDPLNIMAPGQMIFKRKN